VRLAQPFYSRSRRRLTSGLCRPNTGRCGVRPLDCAISTWAACIGEPLSAGALDTVRPCTARQGSFNAYDLRREVGPNLSAQTVEAEQLHVLQGRSPGVMRHFYIRAVIEQRQGGDADWTKVDNLMIRVLAAAEKVAKYRHAQLSAIKLSGDPNAKVDASTVEELLAKIKMEYQKLSPFLDLEVLREPQRSRTKGGMTVACRTIEHGSRSDV
jgi:hypothetical protein